MGRPRDDSWRGPRDCKGCGRSFEPNYREHAYHSPACWYNSKQNIEMFRSQAQSAGLKGGSVRGAQLRAVGTGYSKSPGLDVHEHRAVAEVILGRRLLPGEVVHHEDLNKRNNDPDNLIVFPNQAAHAHHHKMDHCLKECVCPGIRLAEEVRPK